MSPPNHSDKQKVTTIDDTLRIYRDLDLNSTVIAQVAKGVAIQLEAATIYQGREWMRATLENGSVGYVLGPSAHGHTTLGVVGVVSSQYSLPTAPVTTVAQERREAILLGLGFCIATVLGCFGSLVALVPTQGMSGHEPFSRVFLSFSLGLMLIHACGSALGLSILFAVPEGGRLWAWGVGAFVLGAGLAGLLVTIAILSPATPWPMLLSACWLPPLAGLVTMLLRRSA